MLDMVGADPASVNTTMKNTAVAVSTATTRTTAVTSSASTSNLDDCDKMFPQTISVGFVNERIVSRAAVVETSACADSRGRELMGRSVG